MMLERLQARDNNGAKFPNQIPLSEPVERKDPAAFFESERNPAADGTGQSG